MVDWHIAWDRRLFQYVLTTRYVYFKCAGPNVGFTRTISHVKDGRNQVLKTSWGYQGRIIVSIRPLQPSEIRRDPPSGLCGVTKPFASINCATFDSFLLLFPVFFRTSAISQLSITKVLLVWHFKEVHRQLFGFQLRKAFPTLWHHQSTNLSSKSIRRQHSITCRVLFLLFQSL